MGFVLLGTLPHSGRSRGVIAPATDQAHLVEAMDGVLRRLGGTARVWRVDRMATVVEPASGDVQASFAPVAKHYGASVVACPPRRGNRKGSVEAAVRFATGRWWRTLSAGTVELAQAGLDRFWSTTGDARLRSPARIEEPPTALYATEDGLEHPGALQVLEVAVGRRQRPEVMRSPKPEMPGELDAYRADASLVEDLVQPPLVGALGQPEAALPVTEATAVRGDSALHLQLNPDVRAGKVNPRRHYLLHGAAEGRPFR